MKPALLLSEAVLSCNQTQQESKVIDRMIYDSHVYQAWNQVKKTCYSTEMPKACLDYNPSDSKLNE